MLNPNAPLKYYLDKNKRKLVNNVCYYSIVALIDFNDVKKGDVGGLVDNEFVLSHKGNCWIYPGATVGKGSRILENAIVKDNAIVINNTVISGNAIVSENATVMGGKISGYAQIKGETIILSSPVIMDNVIVTDDAIVKTSGYITGNARIEKNAVLHGMCNITGNAKVTGEVKDVQLSFHALCNSRADYFSTENVGTMYEKFIAYKQSDNKGIMIIHSMWNMEIDEFEKDVMKFYKNTNADHKKIIKEYKALIAYTRCKLT